MRIQELSANQRENVYNNYLRVDFHESEVKPLKQIEGLIEKDNYVCYGFFEGEDLLGYTYFVKTKSSNTLLLDYFAVNKQYRSNGLGSKIIKSIKNKLHGKYSLLLGEVENPEFACDDNDKSMRERRIAFYLKNGFKVSNVKSSVLVDDYVIITLNLGKELNDREIYQEMSEIYRVVFGEKFFNDHINILI